MRARVAQNVPSESLAYVAPFRVWGSYGALFFCILICLTKNYNVFIGKFAYKDFVTGYIGIPLYLIMIAGYKLWTKEPGVKPETADLWTGKDVIDREEQEFLARKAERQALKGKNKGGWFYRTFIGWLF